MTAITYTAKRNFVLEGLDVTAIDISIASSDDSFNSVAGEFAGMVAGDWVLVSGSAVDDGWHQLSVDSTSAKITTTSALTNESTGSSIRVIGYKHGLNQSYNLETSAQVLDQSYNAKTRKSESLSSVVETLFFNEVEYWSITTGEVTEANLPYWLEFSSSTRAGESFSFDPYGTIASPDTVKSCRLEGDPQVSRIETGDYYTLSFKVRVI